MLKKQKNLYLSMLVVGLIISVVFSLTNSGDYNSGLLCGLGTSLTVVALFRLVKLHRMSRDPEKLADYEAANKDERILFIANKARALVFLISIYVQLAGGLIAQFVFHQRLINMVICYFTCIQCLLFVVVYRYYSKKY